jgi:hypothetical protein
MHGDHAHLPFLGPCGVCRRELRNYRALSRHLRTKTDTDHQRVYRKWHPQEEQAV